MKRYIAHGVAALAAIFTLSLFLPVSEAEARFRRRGGNCGCNSCDTCGGYSSGCASCDTGESHTMGYRGDTYDNGQAPTPAQGRTYDANQAPPAPSGYQEQGSTQRSTQSNDSANYNSSSTPPQAPQAHEGEGKASLNDSSNSLNQPAPSMPQQPSNTPR